MKKVIYIGLILALCLIMAACSGGNDQAEPGFEVGSVTIISNGIEHRPYARVMHSGTRTPAGTLSASAAIAPLEEIFEMLPEIEYSDDFQVVIDGEDARWITYTWHDANFELVVVDGQMLISMKELGFPDEAGLYILGISVYWSYQPPGASEFVIYEYIVRVRK